MSDFVDYPAPTGAMRPLILPGGRLAREINYDYYNPTVPVAGIWSNKVALVEDPCPYTNGDTLGLTVFDAGTTLARAGATGVEIQTPTRYGYDGEVLDGVESFIRIRNEDGGHRIVTARLSYEGLGSDPYVAATVFTAVRIRHGTFGWTWWWLSATEGGLTNLTIASPEVSLGVWYRYAIRVRLRCTSSTDGGEPPWEWPGGTARVDFTYA